MKKRILSLALVTALSLSLITPASAAASNYTTREDTSFLLATICDLTYYNWDWEDEDVLPAHFDLYKLETPKSRAEVTHSFDDLYEQYRNWPAALGEEACYYFGVEGDQTKSAFNSSTPLAMIVHGKEEIDIEQKIEINGRYTRIASYKDAFTVTMNFKKGISVTDADLLIRNIQWTMSPDTKQALKMVLGEPIEINSGGCLYLEMRDQASLDHSARDTLVAPNGKNAILIKDGGTVHFASFTMERPTEDTSNVPLITVEGGGSLIFEPTSVTRNEDTDLPIYNKIIRRNFVPNIEAAVPIVKVENGGSMTLRYGTLATTAADVPAVVVEEGGTLEITGESEYTVVGQSGRGVTLAEGANLIMNKVRVTTGGADNFIDNVGNLVLAPGATIGGGNPMNAAILLNDGTLIEGTTETAPELTGSKVGEGKVGTQVEIPAGGSVTTADGKQMDLPTGGIVSYTDTGELEIHPFEVHATGITLDRTSLSLYTNTSPTSATLTATLTPENTTDAVSWKSSDENVATVANGVVTAVGNGTATITVTAGDQSATCAVTVSTYYSGGGSSSRDDDTKPAAPSTPVVSAPTTTTTGNEGATTVTTVTTEVKPTLTGTTAKAEVPAETAQKATEEAIAAAKEQSAAPAVEIAVETIKGADSIAVDLPLAALTTLSEEKEATMTVTSDVGTISMDSAALAAIAQQVEGPVTVALGPVASNDLTQTQAAVVGDAPVYDISVTSGNVKVSNFDGGTLKMSIPYTPPKDLDPAGIAVFYLDDDGGLHKCPTSYRADVGTVDFSTTHLSKYMIGYDESQTWANPFADVAGDAWYNDAARWAAHKGVMTGVSATAFAPEGVVTRAQVWTVLARLGGVDTAGGTPWYAPGQAWSVAQGVSDGTNPDGAITREQLVTMLWRNAGSPAPTGTLARYTDAGAVAEYARDAMAWAVSEGIVSGTSDTTLTPGAGAARAQLAAILYRAFGA